MTYDATDPDADGVVEADVDNESVSTETLHSSWTVDAGDFDSIQSAIDFASSNGIGRVEIPSGEYNETVTIDRGIDVIGQGGDLVGNGNGTVIRTETASAVVEFYSIRNSVQDVLVENTGTGPAIEIPSNDRSTIEHCTIEDGDIVVGAGPSIVVGNELRGNDIILESSNNTVHENYDVGEIIDNGNENVIIGDQVRIDGTYYIRAGDGEQQLRNVVSSLSSDERVVFDPNVNITLSDGPLVPPEGATFEGGVSPRGDTITLEKGFDGALLEYPAHFTCKNMRFHGRKGAYNGSGLAPQSDESTPDVYLEGVTIERCDDAGLQFKDAYLSTFIMCRFEYCGVGMRVGGSSHNPWNDFYGCRWNDNDEAGIEITGHLERGGMYGCLIDLNPVGILVDGVSGDSGTTGPFNDFGIGGGTHIHRNDEAGILLQGGQKLGINLGTGSKIANNKQDTSNSSLTAPIGDIHAENGGRIDGELMGWVGDITRISEINEDPISTLIIGGRAGDIDCPNTFLTVLSDYLVGSVDVQTGVGLDPTGGGSLASYGGYSP